MPAVGRRQSRFAKVTLMPLKSKARMLVLVPIAVAFACLGAYAAADWREPAPARFSSAPQNSRWGKDYLPNLPVVDQDGNKYRFYEDLIKDKKVIINFAFTSCTDICPLTTARMAVLQDKLGDAVGRDVHMYTITIDPEHDGPRELKRYAEAFKIKPGWRFLTGRPADIQFIRDRLGERSRIKSEHRHEMLLGNDAMGDWSKDSAYGDIDRVVMNVRALDPDWRAVEPAGFKQSDATYLAISEKPGEALFLKACSSCHTIGKGDRAGPDLLDVAKRRDQAWLKHFVTRPDRMMAERDPVAVALMERFPAVKMPNLGLSEQDAADALAYIEAQSYAVHADSRPKRAAAHVHQH
jgi:protein SCO1